MNLQAFKNHRYSGRRIFWLMTALVMAVNVLLYARTLGYDFQRDDHMLIENNARIKSAKTFFVTLEQKFFAFPDFPDLHYWRPATLFSFLGDYRIWGLDARGFHLTNVLLNGFCAVFVFWIFVQLGVRYGAAFMLALFFSFHPMHAETVAWVSGRTDLLAAFFSLAAGTVWLGYLKKPVWYRLTLALFLFSLALLSKENALLFPLVVLGITLFVKPEKPGPWLRRGLLFFGVAAVFVLGHMLISGSQKNLLGFSFAHVPDMIKTIGVYFKMIVLPFFPTPFFSMHAFDGQQATWLLLAVAALGVFALLLFKKSCFFLSRRAALFLVFILPLLDPNIVPSYPQIAMRFVYLPAVFCGALVLDLYAMVREQGARVLAGAGVVLLLGIWLVQGVVFQGFFVSDDTYYSKLLAACPREEILLYPQALRLAHEKRYRAAIVMAHQAMTLDRDNRWLDMGDMAGVLKANLLLVTGKMEPGRVLAEKIVSGSGTAGIRFNALQVLAKYWEKTGNFKKSQQYLDRALELGKTGALYFRRAVNLLRLGDLCKAEESLEHACTLNPEQPGSAKLRLLIERAKADRAQPAKLVF